MGLRRRYWRKRLARTYRETAEGFTEEMRRAVLDIAHTPPDAEGRVPFPDQSWMDMTDFGLKARETFLRAAELAEADRLEEAVALVNALEQEKNAIEEKWRQDQLLREIREERRPGGFT